MITRKGPSAGPAGHCQSSVRGTVAKPFGSWFKQLANWVQSFKPNAPPGPAPCAVGAPHVSRNSGALSCAPLAGGRSSPAFRSLWLVSRLWPAAAGRRGRPLQGLPRPGEKYSRAGHTRTQHARANAPLTTHALTPHRSHAPMHAPRVDRSTHALHSRTTSPREVVS